MADPGIPSTPLRLPIKLQLFDTLEQRLKEFRPMQPPQVKMYVCGPTVYDAAHLGHARTYITWDVLYRFLKLMGFEATYVRNVTDVDDKIIQRAKELSVFPEVLAQTNYESFQRDMQALNVLPPTLEPKATLYIDKMIEGIQVLVDKGAAYPTPDGTVYFRTSFKREYGELSKKTIDDLQSGARVEVDPNKENPTDFALWKGVKNDEPPLWPTPWGLGRPGWHMECSAMAYSLLGEQLDIHAGGADLIFPHHENEIAQSEAWTGHRPFVNYWLHNGFVNVEGEKMSKSLGNFSTIQKLLDRYDANTIRYFLLTHHYRMPVEFSGSSLEGAENRVTKIHRTLKETALLLNITETQFKGLAKKPNLLGRPVSTPTKFDDPNLADPLYAYFYQFVSAMAEDLNSPQALAVMNEVVRHLNVLKTQLDSIGFDDPISYEFGEGNTFNYPSFGFLYQRMFLYTLSMLYHLGFQLSLITQEGALPVESLHQLALEFSVSIEEDPSLLLESFITLRASLKAAKQWEDADRLRDRLKEMGILLKDIKDGTTWELTQAHERQTVS